MKLKRLLVLFCMIVSCVCLSVAFAACGETAHTHLDAEWSKDATKHWKVCPECNQKYDEGNHSFTDGKCTVCGQEQSSSGENPGTSGSDLDPIEGNPNCDHEWDGGWKTAKDKTCTEDGVQTRTCSICGRREVRPIKTSGHIIVKQAAQPATCTKDGWKEYEICTQCDYTTFEANKEDALGHDYVPHEAQEPTCTEAGWTAYKTCSRCDYDSRDDESVPEDKYLDMIPHKYPSEDETAQCEMCHKTRFKASEGLEIEIVGAAARVVGIGTCTDKVISIPEEYEGRPVIDICESAFSPNKPTEYSTSWSQDQKNDFDKKAALLNEVEEVKMRGIKMIDDSAFAFMPHLKTVDLGSSLQRINTMAFAACYELTEITIPKTCSVVEAQAFFRSDALREIKVEEGSQLFTSYDNHLLIKNGTGELIAASMKIDKIGESSVEHVTIPETVKSINEYAFFGHFYLQELVIPGSVKTINRSAFDGCTGLKTLTIEAGVNTICSNAFSNCTKLSDVTIKTMDVEETDAEGNTTTRSSFRLMQEKCFGNCPLLEDITFEGTAEQWKQVQKTGDELLNGATTETKPNPIRLTIYCDDGAIFTEMAGEGGFRQEETD